MMKETISFVMNLKYIENYTTNLKHIAHCEFAIRSRGILFKKGSIASISCSH